MSARGASRAHVALRGFPPGWHTHAAAEGDYTGGKKRGADGGQINSHQPFTAGKPVDPRHFAKIAVNGGNSLLHGQVNCGDDGQRHDYDDHK